MLPLPAAITSQLDKASIIRLTISYLKLRDFSGHGDPPWQRDNPPPNKSLKGTKFAFFFSSFLFFFFFFYSSSAKLSDGKRIWRITSDRDNSLKSHFDCHWLVIGGLSREDNTQKLSFPLTDRQWSFFFFCWSLTPNGNLGVFIPAVRVGVPRL